MRTTFVALFTVLLVAVAAGNSKDNHSQKESGQWNLSEPAYGQFRLVPSLIIPHKTKVEDWNGPWTEYKAFVFQFGSSKGHQTSPRNYRFVMPTVNLEGFDSRRREGYGTSIHLFERESTENDIVVTLNPVPEKIQFDQEYLAATISGDNSAVTWQVFVRFTTVKPSYVRSGASE